MKGKHRKKYIKFELLILFSSFTAIYDLIYVQIIVASDIIDGGHLTILIYIGQLDRVFAN